MGQSQRPTVTEWFCVLAAPAVAGSQRRVGRIWFHRDGELVSALTHADPFAAPFKFERGDTRQLTTDARGSVCCPFQV